MIKQLSEDIINQIAAGEVIEKPASIVRELLDNSIDAGSSFIQIEVDLNDDFSITITDDGCGIKKDELSLAFRRYATSKISSFSDIYDIKHLGFRGEALASIAAISEITLISKFKDDDIAHAIDIRGGKVVKEYPTSSNQGTQIIVKNIFYNTPVRKKFLKNLIYEKQEIKKEVIAHILSVENIHFVYRSKKNNQIREELNIHKTFTFKDKIASLYKQIPKESLIEIEVEANGFVLKGYISDQTYRAKSKKDQYLIFKNRMTYNSTFQSAFQSCYVNILPSKTFPACFLKLDTPKNFTDVNVHPAKKEIKFQDNKIIYNFFYQNLKSILYQKIYEIQKSDIDKSINNSLNKEPFSNHYHQQKESNPFSKFTFQDIVQDKKSPSSFFNTPSSEKPEANDLNSFLREKQQQTHTENSSVDNPNTIEGQRDIKKIQENLQIFGQVAKGYILFALGNDLFIGDQHAIHERINFDMLNEIIKNNKKVERQVLLTPLIIHRNQQEIEIILGQQEQLKQFGIIISAFGKDAVKINEISSFFKEDKITQVINDVLDKLCDNLNLTLAEFLEKVTSTIACRMSIMSGDELSEREIRDLIISLYQKDYIYNCPHGRPFLKKISHEDLLAFFERSKHLPGM